MKSYRAWSELTLFQAIGQGDEKALSEFKIRIERCGRHLGKGWARPVGETEIQEIVSRVLEKLEGLRRRGFTGGNAGFRTYLYKVVASQAVEVRKEQTQHISLDEPIEMPNGETKPLRELAGAMINPHWSALKELEVKEERRRLQEAFQRLDERCQKLLWAKEVERHREQEIAAHLQMTLSNVWASLHRCRERLYQLLLASLQAGKDSARREKITRLAERLTQPLAEVFQLWWRENRSLKEIARHLQREEREIKELLARAKAAVWQLAQETGDP